MAPVVLPHHDMTLFNEFNVLTEVYETHGTTPVKAQILIPKSLFTGRAPVIINFHGGGLISGHALFTPFFPPWILTLAKSKSAVIISVDYSLLPNSEGLEAITNDIATFWTWLHSSLPQILSARTPNISLDLERILVNGGSAGGYLATSLALSHPEEIRALAIAYPMLDFDSDWFRKGTLVTGATNVFGMPDEFFPSTDVTRARGAELLDDVVVTEGEWERFGLYGWYAHKGLMWELFDPQGTLDSRTEQFPVRRVSAGIQLPDRVWILHGEADTAVPADGSRVFYAEAKKVNRDRQIRLDIVPGMEHGFDSLPVPEMGWKGAGDPLIESALNWLSEKWLAE